MNRPQFAKRSHPAIDRVQTLGRDHPGIWQDIDSIRSREPPPPEVYLTDPQAAEALAMSIVRNAGQGALHALLQAGEMAVAHLGGDVCTLAAWRMTQGIYRVDPALYPTLIDTDMRGDLPAEVLTRLPEWCIYIETPGLTTPSQDGRSALPVRGAFVRLAIENAGQRVLVVGPDVAEIPIVLHQSLPLVGTLASSIQGVLNEWRGHADAGRYSADPGAMPGVLAYLAPVINILLYIVGCSDDIHGSGQHGNPEPVRTRRDGWKMFPAQGSTTWDVGLRMGAALRRAYAAEQTGQGGAHAGPRPHMRRAHWHTILSGPRLREDGTPIPTQERRADLRWMPPIAVNLGASGPDDLPAVVRIIK